jgi:hypothetical protein
MKPEQKLWTQYCTLFAPEGSRPRKIGAEECIKILWSFALEIGELTKGFLPPLKGSDIKEVDNALVVFAQNNDIDALKNISREGLVELNDRLSWSMSALKLQFEAGAPYQMIVPSLVSDDIVLGAVLVLVLAGEGKQVPHGLRGRSLLN